MWSLALGLLSVGWAVAQTPVYTGPCTRRTSIVLSEILYHPPGEATASTAFIELYNSSPIGADLSGWKLRGDVDFTIPDDAKEVRARVRKWVQEECIPAEKEMAAGKAYKTVL